MYRGHYRFFETEDEYFDYPSHASRQGRWQIYGIALPDEALKQIYRSNAAAILSHGRPSIGLAGATVSPAVKNVRNYK